MASHNTLEDQVLAQKWFYKFQLPSGKTTEQYVGEDVDLIHTTRRDMMLEALKPLDLSSMTAIDFSSHQGYFSVELAKRCKRVLGLEYQEGHVASAKLISKALGLTNVSFVQEDLERMPKDKHEPADIVINFGLMYNLENPIAVLRRSRELTKKVLLIETQTTILDLEGAVDSGHYANTNYMHGYFGIFAGNPQNIDGSASDIVFYPSKGGLIWVLKRLGFQKVEVLPPPPGAYQQLASGKRIMVAAWL
jgi:tRNA (mo5U34)-methyltransferase